MIRSRDSVTVIIWPNSISNTFSHATVIENCPTLYAIKFGLPSETQTITYYPTAKNCFTPSLAAISGDWSIAVNRPYNHSTLFLLSTTLSQYTMCM